MAFVVDVLPAFAFLRVEDDLFEFLHEGVNHLQGGTDVFFLVGLFELVDILVGDERIVTQRVKDVDRLEGVFLPQEGVQVFDVHEASMFPFADGRVDAQFLDRSLDQFVEVVAGEHEQILRVEAARLAHRDGDVVYIGEPLAVDVDAIIDIVRQDIAEVLLDAIAPELEHAEGQSNERVITLRMHLFAEEMHQLVLTARDLVHVGGDVSDLPFRADLVEIDREDAGELFHLLIIGTDVGVEDLGDLPLEQVRVAQEDAAQFEVDDQRGEQFLHGELGVFDEFQPDADVLDMVLIHRELPVLVDEDFARPHEPEVDEFLLEVVDDLLLFRLVHIDDLEAEGELEVKHGRHIVLAQFPGEVEDGVDEGDQLLLGHLIDGVAHHAVHVPDQAFPLVLHAREVQEEEDEMELGDEMREHLLRLCEAAGYLFEDRQIRQCVPSVGGVELLLEIVEVRFANLVDDGDLLFRGEQFRLVLNPLFHLAGLLPIAVVLLQHEAQQLARLVLEGLILGKAAEVTTRMFCGEDEGVLVRLKAIVEDLEGSVNEVVMFGRLLLHHLGELHEGDDDAESEFQRHLRTEQVTHHVEEDQQRVVRDVVAGIEPEVVEQHLTQFFRHKGMVGERMMELRDAVVGPFMDAEVFG